MFHIIEKRIGETIPWYVESIRPTRRNYYEVGSGVKESGHSGSTTQHVSQR